MNRRDDAVKRPSFSIAELMVIVAIVALDCLAIRFGAHAGVLVGGLPMQSALVIGLPLVVRWRRCEDMRLPFLIGFEVGGWISSVILFAVCVFVLRSFDEHLSHVLEPFLRGSGFAPFSTPDMIVRITLGACYVTAPQLAIALAAGLISQRLCKRTHSEPVPTHE
jgi:hypothetical protein